ncbi:MAG: hypothetical protein HRT87_08435 [Legionellales bacterium]|nr:hypothetical protein [Legionellales bacterium]
MVGRKILIGCLFTGLPIFFFYQAYLQRKISEQAAQIPQDLDISNTQESWDSQMEIL